MRIVQLSASNFARLRAVEIRPSGAIVPITGKNSQGKTSVLRAIWTALLGRAVAPPKPIHEGAEQAIIKLDIGPLKITRTFRHDKHGDVTSDLTVVDEDGGRVRKTPQALIDALLGDLSFDPLAFARLKPADQFERLKALVPDVDFDALAQERQSAYDDRTAVNRKAKEQATLAGKIELPAGPEPAEANVNSLLEELSKATQENNKRDTMLGQARECIRRSSGLREEIDRLEAQVREMRVHATQLEGDAKEIEANVPAAVDISSISERIASANKVQEVRKRFAAKREHEAAAKEAEAESQRLTDDLAAIDKTVRDAIAKARLPAGLSLDPETRMVLLHGLPFEQAGTAEKINASAEIAMSLNPDLRVMLIDEGSELDSEHLGLLEELAEARDHQIWIARVEEGESGTGFRIEDGYGGAFGEVHAKPGQITDAVVERAKSKR